MIDSHCHLAHADFAADLPEVVQRAYHSGVTRMICIADTLKESGDCLAIARRYPSVWCSIGLHPHRADQWTAQSADMIRQTVLTEQRVVAIGEIGLDYHYDFCPRDLQREVLAAQLSLCGALRLPAIIHCREAFDDLWATVQDIRPPAAVWHCCTGEWDQVQRWIEWGYSVSFTGIATYPKSTMVREVIARCPIDKILLETDAPFLAPVPHRGKRCEPAFVAEVVRCVAEVKGMALMDIDRITTANTVALFGLPA